jgi:hypothetical protein
MLFRRRLIDGRGSVNGSCSVIRNRFASAIATLIDKQSNTTSPEIQGN